MIVINLAHWAWPQWLTVIWWALGLIVTAIKHGQPKDYNWNFPVELIGVAIAATVFTFGGFFG